MKVVDYLILILKAHSEAISRLADLLGREETLRLLLESENEASQYEPLARHLSCGKVAPHDENPYDTLEQAVEQFGLPDTFSYHLWSYPLYRCYIESPIRLDSIVELEKAVHPLVESTIEASKRWIRDLRIPETHKNSLISQMNPSWNRLRSDILHHSGQKRLHLVGGQ